MRGSGNSGASARHWKTVLAVLALGATLTVTGAPAATASPGDRVILAGTGSPGDSGTGGPSTAAQLRRASAIEVTATRSIIADELSHRVRFVDSTSSTMGLVAGTGTAGFSGDGGPAVLAKLNRPRGLAVDAAGATYIADAGNARVRKVAPTGIITTVAGTGVVGYSGDGGPATSARLSNIEGVATDAAGNLYIADAGNHVVRKVSTTGTITTVAGTGAVGLTDNNLPADRARLARPADVDVDEEGNLYIADETARRVLKVDTAGMLRRIAGNGTYGTVAWSAATATGLKNPSEVEVEPGGESILIGTDEGVYALSGVGRIARASEWGEDAPDVDATVDANAVDAIAVRTNGDLLLGVGPTVQVVERPIGSISGRAFVDVDQAWLPVGGVRVQLLDPTGAPVAETTTDATGRYRVAATVGQWNLRFTKPGFRDFDFLTAPGPLAAGVRVPLGSSVTLANPYLDFANGSGAALHGRVTAPTGAHPSTSVVLHGPGGTSTLPIGDQDGRFLFAGLAPGTYTLEVDPALPWEDGWWSPAGGFSEGPVPFTVSAADIAADLRVPRATFALTGLVSDDRGQLVTSGSVEAYDPVTHQLLAASEVDSLGRYRIDYAAPTPPEVALQFHAAWDDTVHLDTWLGGTAVQTPASVVDIGTSTDDVGADLVVRTQPI